MHGVPSCCAVFFKKADTSVRLCSLNSDVALTQCQRSEQQLLLLLLPQYTRRDDHTYTRHSNATKPPAVVMATGLSQPIGGRSPPISPGNCRSAGAARTRTPSCAFCAALPLPAAATAALKRHIEMRSLFVVLQKEINLQRRAPLHVISNDTYKRINDQVGQVPNKTHVI